MPAFNPEPFCGQRVKIATVEPVVGDYGHQLLVKTEGIKDEAGNAIQFDDKPLVAQRWFSLFQGEDGKFFVGVDSALDVFLRSHRVTNPNDLVGKEVTLKLRVAKKGKSAGKTFLDF